MVAELAYRLALRIVMTMLVLAALDYAYQRWSLEKSMRMSKEEVKQEFKNQEGNPQIKARIRARQRAIAKKRMMADVPTADVIVMNPTHFAVALKYDPTRMSAPIVVAKGQDLLALKIRELAQQNDVPIMENPPLARALHKNGMHGPRDPRRFIWGRRRSSRVRVSGQPASGRTQRPELTNHGAISFSGIENTRLSGVPPSVLRTRYFVSIGIVRP